MSRVSLKSEPRETEKNGKKTMSESHSTYGMIYPEVLRTAEGFNQELGALFVSGKATRSQLNNAIRALSLSGFAPEQIWQITVTHRTLSLESIQ